MAEEYTPDQVVIQDLVSRWEDEPIRYNNLYMNLRFCTRGILFIRSENALDKFFAEPYLDEYIEPQMRQQ